MRSALLRASLLAALFASSPAPAAAQPLCTEARDGVAACIDGKLCACRFERGGSLSGRRSAMRWDCGALRPSCGPPPPDQPPHDAGPPPGFPLGTPMPFPPGWR